MVGITPPPSLRLGRGLSWIFLVTSLMGLVLAGFIYARNQAILLVSAPFIEQKIPLLSEIGQLERIFLKSQMNHYAFFAGTIDAPTYHKLQQITHTNFIESLNQLEHAIPHEKAWDTIRESFDHASALSAVLEQSMRKHPVDTNQVRGILADMLGDTETIKHALSGIRAKLERSVYREGQTIATYLRQITPIVLLYSLVIVIIAVVVAYHIDAKSRAEQALTYQLHHDPITGAPNRRALENTIAHWKTEHARLLTLVTIQRFEQLVCTLGHDVADKVLLAVAQQLERYTQPIHAQLFRLDGPIFGIAYPVFHGLTRDAQLILQITQQPLLIEQNELLIDIQCGSACYPRDGHEPHLLIQNAYLALNQAHRTQKHFVDYHPNMLLYSGEKLRMEVSLSRAIQKSEFILHYQPQQSLHTGQIIGLEALIRWKNGDTMIPPAAFIPLAEESGAIVAIGEWIMKEAFFQAKQWEQAGFQGLTIGINVSARQFVDPRFMVMVQSLLQETGANPAMIEMEITESALMPDQNSEKLIQELLLLRELGFCLAIDDFGTGYSALSYLRRLPVHRIKIDKSFIDPLETPDPARELAIVEAIIKMAHTLQLRVIAEGVETLTQWERLHQLGCDEIQGYWLSKPLSASDSAAFLRAYPHNPPLEA